jgi:hypothetical protein
MYRRRFIPRRGMGTFTEDLAAAITRFEGACTSPGVCRNNNPGNLRAGPGAIGTDSRGIAIFPDFATGQAAELRQVDLNIGRGLSLSEFFGGKPGVYPGYAPAGDSNDPGNYARTVAGWLDIDPSTPLASISGSQGASQGTQSDLPDSGGTDGSELSTGAMVGLGIAGLALLFAVSA